MVQVLLLLLSSFPACQPSSPASRNRQHAHESPALGRGSLSVMQSYMARIECRATLHEFTLSISPANICDSCSKCPSVQPDVADKQVAFVLRLQGLDLQLILLEPYLRAWGTLANKGNLSRSSADAQSGITLDSTLCGEHRQRHAMLQLEMHLHKLTALA